MTTQTHNPANLPGGPERWERVMDGCTQNGDYLVYPNGGTFCLTAIDLNVPISDCIEDNDDGGGVIVHIYRLKTTPKATVPKWADCAGGIVAKDDFRARFGTPSNPDGSLVLIAAALINAEAERDQLKAQLYTMTKLAGEMAQKLSYDQSWDEAVALVLQYNSITNEVTK